MIYGFETELLHVCETFSELCSPNNGNSSSRHRTDSDWNRALLRTQTSSRSSSSNEMKQTVTVSKILQCKSTTEIPLPKTVQPNKKAEGNYSTLLDSILTCRIMLKASRRHPSTAALPEGILYYLGGRFPGLGFSSSV